MRNELTPERRLLKLRTGLMNSKQFVQLTGLMMYGKHEICDETPTCSTDGVDEFYGREWVQNSDNKEVGFGIIHENLHKAGRHLCIYHRLYAKDFKLANYACDFWNNAKIVEADPECEYTRLPTKDGKVYVCFDKKYIGWSIKRIFYDLWEQKQEHQKNQPQGGGAGGGTPEGGEEFVPQGAGDFDDHDWESAGAKSVEQTKEESNAIAHAIQTGNYAARQKHGLGGGGDVLGLNALVAPTVQWEQELRAFWSSTVKKKQSSTWNRPNRRFLHQNIILPSRKGRGINEVVYARDTSGSMASRNRLARVTSEVVQLAKLVYIERIHFIDWDGEVERHEIYKSTEIDKADMTLKPTGGGGTDPTCVSDYLTKHNIKPDCVIIATDGEVGSWGTWSSPLLWMIVNNNPIKARVGKTINVEDVA